MRIVFLGSPEFALPTLERLLQTRHEVVAVVTQPDRPAGRGHAETPPPVKVMALEHGLPVLQPERVSDDGPVEALRALEADVFVVAAYGQILRRRVLELPKRGCLNVHASLLPRHRGASPVAAAILAGDEVTGVSIMEMVRALDAGPVVATVEEPVLPSDTAGSLEARLAVAGARRLVEVLDGWAAGNLQAVPQDEAQASYAPQIRRTDALIDWTRSAVEIWRTVRAYNPWPIAYTTYGDQELRIHQAWALPDGHPGTDGPGNGKEPGTVLGTARLPAEAGTADVEAPVVQTGDGVMAVLRLQRQGGRPLSGTEFLRGQRGFVGARLGL
jgi:methionyl-tRNA formyltransferase